MKTISYDEWFNLLNTLEDINDTINFIAVFSVLTFVFILGLAILWYIAEMGK